LRSRWANSSAAQIWLVCDCCERPLTIVGGSHSRYYRCTTSRRTVAELPSGMEKTAATVIGAIRGSFDALGPGS
jgi:hypothetical protein